MEGKTAEDAALASVRSVGVGSASQCGGGTTSDGASLASVLSVGVASVSHCESGHDS
jgi:hypothetical protein